MAEDHQKEWLKTTRRDEKNMVKALPTDFLFAYRFAAIIHFDGDDANNFEEPKFMGLAKMKATAEGLEIWRGIRIGQPMLHSEICDATRIEVKVYGRESHGKCARRTMYFDVANPEPLPFSLDASDSNVAAEGVLFRFAKMTDHRDEEGYVDPDYPGWWFKKEHDLLAGGAVEWTGVNDSTSSSVVECPSLEWAKQLVRKQEGREEKEGRAKIARLSPTMQLTCPKCGHRAFVPDGTKVYENCHTIRSMGDDLEIVCAMDCHVFGWWDGDESCWWSESPLVATWAEIAVEEREERLVEEMPLPFAKG